MLLVFACSSEETVSAGPSTTPPEDAGVDRRRPSSTAKDGGVDVEEEEASVEPTVTEVDVTIGGVKRTLDIAQFGTETSGSGTKLLYVEAHFDGDPACADGGTRGPANTLTVGDVPRGAVGASFTKADGVYGTYWDFTGDQLKGDLQNVQASAITVTITAIGDGDDPSFVDFDVEATLPDGTAKGHVHAEYCSAMSR
jgi:hypothetical protein